MRHKDLRTILFFGVLCLSFWHGTSVLGDSFAPIDEGGSGGYISVANPAPSPAEHHQARQQFEQAERMAITRQLDNQSAQRTLDHLMEQKAVWQREVIAAKTKVALAKEKMAQANTLGSQEEVKKWQGEIETYESRVK